MWLCEGNDREGCGQVSCSPTRPFPFSSLESLLGVTFKFSFGDLLHEFSFFSTFRCDKCGDSVGGLPNAPGY